MAFSRSKLNSLLANKEYSDASNYVNCATHLEVFNPIRRWGRGWVGVEVAPHHTNVYTLKESIGENSDNFL